MLAFRACFRGGVDCWPCVGKAGGMDRGVLEMGQNLNNMARRINMKKYVSYKRKRNPWLVTFNLLYKLNLI